MSINVVHDAAMNKEENFAYRPDIADSHVSTVELLFKPSPELADALTEFMDQTKRRRHGILLRSAPVRDLPVVGGDSNGLKHWRVRGSDGADQSDTEWLAAYDKDIQSLNHESIPAADGIPTMENLADGSLAIELSLLPNARVRRKIGGALLRKLAGTRDDEQVCVTTIAAHLVIPSSKRLMNESAHAEARAGLIEKLEATAGGGLQSSPVANRMFVTDPFVSDRLIR